MAGDIKIGIYWRGGAFQTLGFDSKIFTYIIVLLNLLEDLNTQFIVNVGSSWLQAYTPS